MGRLAHMHARSRYLPLSSASSSYLGHSTTGATGYCMLSSNGAGDSWLALQEILNGDCHVKNATAVDVYRWALGYLFCAEATRTI